MSNLLKNASSSSIKISKEQNVNVNVKMVKPKKGKKGSKKAVKKENEVKLELQKNLSSAINVTSVQNEPSIEIVSPTTDANKPSEVGLHIMYH